MPNPFPGVDPFVESQGRWPDFHFRFLNYWCEALADRLPDTYEASLDERVNLVDEPDGRSVQIRPDVAVVRRDAPARGRAAGAALMEPVTIPTLILDEDHEVYIKILHRPDRSLVAVLELLSPANKVNPGRRDYLVRRNAILRQDVHLIELDLLLSGQRLPMLEPLPPGDCFAFVARADRRPDCDVYAWSIRRALPNHIPIPLRAPDPDVSLDLAAVYATAHEKGRYARSLDYAAPLNLPLAPDDLTWAQARGREVARH